MPFDAPVIAPEYTHTGLIIDETGEYEVALAFRIRGAVGTIAGVDQFAQDFVDFMATSRPELTTTAQRNLTATQAITPTPVE